MLEDDGYRASSQYRCWSFTRQRLEDMRYNTNAAATKKIKAAFKKSRSAQDETRDVTDQTSEAEIQTLSVDEELKLVEWGSAKIMEMGEAMDPRVPSHIVATAIQYLRRFYLTNSPMTYHPKQITACALFLATKADHFYIPLHKFVNSLDNTKEADVKAPEFLLMQSLRFTLEVRHPMRALEGGVAELQSLAAEGQLGTLDRQVEGRKQTAAHRIGYAADKAKALLVTAAQMTDVYFLYTPSQIFLASLLANDPELVLAYIQCVFDRLGDANYTVKDKVISTVAACAELLTLYVSPNDDPARAKGIRKAGRKLNAYTGLLGPTKIGEKREGSANDAEKALKKRKMERERLERDGDVFGGQLHA